jgi:3-hydroxybutyryl-CoA dehydrogenase
MIKVAVLGAGVMGNGIAHSLAAGGYDVELIDSMEAALHAAREHIAANLRQGVQRGKMSEGDAKAALDRIASSKSIASAAGCELVIEAIPEDISLKHKALEQLQSVCGQDVVFATNTSALSITEIAACLADPSRVVGMHYFNPAHIMKLVEIVRGLQTADRAVELVEKVARRCGKETVLVNEAPGFATSRINAMIGNEAFYMLMEGVASARDIDKALKLGLNHPMGPFEMIDLVGLDTRLKVLEYLHATLGEKFRPCPLLIKYVKAGRLGRKVGRGVYDYPEEKK